MNNNEFDILARSGIFGKSTVEAELRVKDIQLQQREADVVELVDTLREALQALYSESSQWQAEGYQGEYHQEEIDSIRRTLDKFSWVPRENGSYAILKDAVAITVDAGQCEQSATYPAGQQVCITGQHGQDDYFCMVHGPYNDPTKNVYFTVKRDNLKD
jgi:hypothetical protein